MTTRSRPSPRAMAIAGVLAIALGASAGAQRTDPVDLLFKAAQHAELVGGNLTDAIKLYEQIVSAPGTSRAMQARALLQMARCYERLGQPEAGPTYARVARDFQDQPEAARAARARLDALERGERNGQDLAQLAYRVVLSEFYPRRSWNEAAPLDFSPDGTRFVFLGPSRDSGDPDFPFAGDVRASRVRPLFVEGLPWSAYRSPRWSPDDRWIAFLAHKGPSLGADPWAIVLVDPQTGASRQVGPDFPDPGAPAGICWSPDSRSLAFFWRDGLYTLPIESGRPQLVQTIPTHPSMVPAGFSPDGRWLAFHKRDLDIRQTSAVDIWIVPARGGTPIRVTTAPELDAQPTWAVDSRAIYFVSERGGDANVWKTAIDPASGAPMGRPEQVTSFRDATIRYPRMLTGGRQLAFALSKQSHTIHVADADRPDRSQALRRGRSPLLSPDGGIVYFVGEGPDESGIFAVSSGGGTPRRLTDLAPASGFDLSPDGRAIAFFASVGGWGNLYTIATADGALRLVRPVRQAAGKWTQTSPRWSPDSRAIAFADEGNLIVVPTSGERAERLAQFNVIQETLWSPDGSFLAVMAYAGATDQGIFAIPAAGGRPARLTSPDERGYKEGLSWHPDSRRLTYMIYLPPGQRASEIREAYVDGRPTTRLIDQPRHWDWVGRWSPDGQAFFFLASPDQTNGMHLYRWDAATGGIALVAEHVATGESGLAQSLVAWSADRRRMAWTVQTDVHQLWLVENFR